jgi:hypothetical protein
MAIAAELSSPSGLPSAADWAAVGGAAASETSVTASDVVASAAIAIAIADDDDHPRDGHDANDRIQTMTTDNRMDLPPLANPLLAAANLHCWPPPPPLPPSPSPLPPQGEDKEL